MGLAELLKGILAHHNRLGHPLDSVLVRGAGDGDVVGTLRGIDLDAPKELVELFEQFNGTSVVEGDLLDDIHLFPGFYWLNLEEAARIYRSVSHDSRWHASWLPVFANGGGDFFNVICDAGHEHYGGVVGFLMGEIDHPVEFVSLNSMLKVILRCFDSSAFYLTTDGFLEADDEAQFRIAAELNPNLPFYTEPNPSQA